MNHNKGYKDGFEKGLVDGQKEALKKVVEWGEGLCDHQKYPSTTLLPRKRCEECWQALLGEIKE